MNVIISVTYNFVFSSCLRDAMFLDKDGLRRGNKMRLSAMTKIILFSSIPYMIISRESTGPRTVIHIH